MKQARYFTKYSHPKTCIQIKRKYNTGYRCESSCTGDTHVIMFPDNWKNVTLKHNFSVEPSTEEHTTRKRRRKNNAGQGGGKSAKAAASETPAPNVPIEGPAIVQKSNLHTELHKENVDKLRVVAKGALQRTQNLPCSEAKMEAILKNVGANLQSIVSMTNYKKVLSGVDTHNLIYTSEIKPVSKKYEDSYLRQAIATGERSCVRGRHCECQFIDPTCPFVGVEFVLPWESEEKKRNGLCLPCLRAATQIFFFDLLQSNERVEGLIQKFFNLHSTEGEYDLGAMLVCPPNGCLQNLPLPIVRHQRNFYRVFKRGDICYMEQVGVAYKDPAFREAPCL